VLFAFLPTVRSASLRIFACYYYDKFSAFTNYFCSSKFVSNLGKVLRFFSASPVKVAFVLLTSSLLLRLEPYRMIRLPILRVYFIFLL
jgi:hypothetical protein